jgi:hypothetical protein
MKTIVLAAVALVLGAVAGDAATLCARNSRRAVVRPACRAGEDRVDATPCVRKNGQVVLRAACRAGERRFDATVLPAEAPRGPDGAPGPAGDPARFPLRIVDATGQDLGEIEELHPVAASVQVDRAPLARPILFYVSGPGFVSNIGGALSNVFYAKTDCAGVPYIRPDGLGGVRAQVYGTAAYYSEAQSGSIHVVSSEFDVAGAPCPTGTTATPRDTCCVNDTPTDVTLQAAVRVPLASLGFVPPFRAVAR